MKQVALIGLGMVSDIYAQAIRNSLCVDLKFVHARREESIHNFLKANSDLSAKGGSLEQIASDPEIDFVIVTTPPNARLEIVDKLSALGKPILMEKPVERTAQSARNLVEICETRNVPLGIMLQHRAREVVSLLRDHLVELGDIQLVEVNVPWWRDQAYYDEPGRGTYERDGGGVLISQAIHTLDLMLSLTGPVESVTAMATTTAFHKMESEDTVTAGLQFEGGAVGSLFASTASFPGRSETIVLHCEKGSATLEAGVISMKYQDGRSITLGEVKSSGAGADPMAFTSDWHQSVIDDFAKALDEKRPPLVSGRDALEVHYLIEALIKSSCEGRKLSLSEVIL